MTDSGQEVVYSYRPNEIADSLRMLVSVFQNDPRWGEAEAMSKNKALVLSAAEHINKLERLLARYRDETPLGNQPHMIANDVDEILGRK